MGLQRASAVWRPPGSVDSVAFLSLQCTQCVLGGTFRDYRPSRCGKQKALHILPMTVRANMIDPVERAHVQILHVGDNGSYVAVNKPSGMLVHRNEALARNDRVFLTDVTRKQLMAVYGIDAPVFVVHRLDRATSGVMLFAIGTPERAASLQNVLQDVNVTEKQYWALTRVPEDTEVPASWTNTHALKNMSKSKSCEPQSARTEFVKLLALRGAESDTIVRSGEEGEDDGMDTQVDEIEPHQICVVRASLHTGRRHQIRRHLANERFPIVGDTSYGKGRHNREMRRLYGVGRLALHSRRLTFLESEELGGNVRTIEAPVPRDLRNMLCRVPGFDSDKDDEICDLGLL